MRRLGLALVMLVPLLLSLIVVGYLGLERGTPSVDDLLVQHARIAPGTKVFATDGTLLTQINAQKGIYHPLRDMPTYLINAVIATEDSRFFSHGGIDIIAITRAFFTNLLHGEIRQGGSTITQQLAKVLFLTPERTLRRKLREAYLAIKIERRFSKKDILELYLNEVYFGHGAYGVEMATKVYFGKTVSELSLPEAALLAGLIRSPLLYSPFQNQGMAKKRQTEVLERMVQEGFITPGQEKEALKLPIILSKNKTNSDENGYFIDYVTKYLETRYSTEEIYQYGLNVYTTLMPQIQHEAQQALQGGLQALDKREGWRGPLRHGSLQSVTLTDEATFRKKLDVEAVMEAVVRDVDPQKAILDINGKTGIIQRGNAAWAQKVIEAETGKIHTIQKFRLNRILKAGDVVLVRVLKISENNISLALEQTPRVQGALICVEPATGYVRAMVGGYDYGKSQFNRAVYAERQPGSAFKPIIYAAALEKGRTPATIIDDEPISYFDETGKEWSPENYDSEYHGPTTLRKALAYSRNVVSVQLLEDIGIDIVIQYAKAFGLKSDFPHDLTLALGTLSITPMQLVTAYTPFANGGILSKPIFVTNVISSSGSVMESNTPSGTQVISPETAFLLTTMLQDAARYGTAWRVGALGRGDLAAKTGTTNDFRDAWFIGYNPELLAGVWVGFDNMTSLGENEAGAKAAGPIWVEFMSAALQGKPELIYEPPNDITTYIVNSETGLLVHSPLEELAETYYQEYFKNGTEPLMELGPEELQQERSDYKIFN